MKGIYFKKTKILFSVNETGFNLFLVSATCRINAEKCLECSFRYSDLMLSMMKPDSQYYIFTREFDPTAWPGK